MDEIAVIKKRLQKEEWSERIRQCRESGLTIAEWCRQNSINQKTYYYHLKKLRKELCEQIPVPVITVSEVFPTVKIHIKDVTIEITENISEQKITSLIRAIRNA